MNLSKSKYCKGIQCPKILWMDANMPEQFDQSVINERLFEVGNEVGDLAMRYYGSFVEVPYSKDKNIMVRETQKLLAAGIPIITEAAFYYDGNYCIVDILRAVNGSYELIEVKSSTSSPREGLADIKPIYLHDMAYQLYVLRNCGLSVHKVSIMQLNKEYVRQGPLDIDELFVLVDCTGEVRQMQHSIVSNIANITKVAVMENEPRVNIGSRCDNPYECGYKSWCYRHLPEDNIFKIGWRMLNRKKDEAYKAGIVSFNDILYSGISLSDKQRRQVESATRKLSPHIDRSYIRSFLSSICYPLYHLDFETFQQAIPLWDNISPYAQIPFQYSIHIQSQPCGSTVHKEFLAKEGIDPRREFAERLCSDIPRTACVLAYYKGFEQGRLRELSYLFPDLSNLLMSIHNNMVDLAQPFKDGAYYCREMGGSFSIKYVLPALCPNDYELDYNKLNIIRNGTEAMNAYATLHEKSPREITNIRAALLAYCRLDTLAMVKMLEKLYRV